MAVTEKQLADNLKEAGTRLLPPPSSVDELLLILDEVQKYLEMVEQSPSRTMQDALWPTRKALVSNELLGHTDPDVNVSVAICISEITRITAPDAPYGDDQMKEIFQLIVSTFQKLDDLSSRSFSKRAAILDIVAKVRSCVVMLDLECDALILDMFQHFLKSVTDNHPEKVFSSIETIMNLVIEESEEISPELLSPILEALKKDNTSVDPAARRLGENVLNQSASKVQPYLVHATKTLGLNLDNYSSAVSAVCQGISGAREITDANTASKNLASQVDSPNPSSRDEVKVTASQVDAPNSPSRDEVKVTASQVDAPNSPSRDEIKACQVDAPNPSSRDEVKACQDDAPNSSSRDEFKEGKETSIDTPTTTQDEVSPAPGELEPMMSNGNLPKVVEEPEVVEELTDHIENKATENPKTTVRPLTKGKSNKKKGRKGNPSKSTSKPSAKASLTLDNGAEEVTEPQESKQKDSENLHCEDDTPAGNKSPSNIEKKADTDVESKVVVKEVEDSNMDPEIKASKSKEDKVTGEDTSSTSCKEEDKLRGQDSPLPVDESKDDDQSTIVPDTKTKKVSGKKVESGSDQKTEKKRKGQGKPALIKDIVKPLPKKERKDPESSPRKKERKDPESSPPKKERKDPESSPPKKERKEPESPPPKSAAKSAKTEVSSASSKRKRSTGKEKASEAKKYAEDLVGSKIRVWWPKDKQFYKGIVESFNPANKKYRVLYSDGDVEVLNLAKEKWERIKDDENSDKGDVSDDETPDASEMRTKKKTKTIPESSNKSGNSQSAKKKVGASRSKVAVSKPGSKQNIDEVTVEKKTSDDEDSKHETDKISSDSDSDSDSGEESMDETPKASGKSKEDDSETPKPRTKFKQQTLKGNTKSKDKTGKGSKTKGKDFSSASKGNESKKSPNESTKSTPPEALKSETNSAKKRKRGSSKK